MYILTFLTLVLFLYSIWTDTLLHEEKQTDFSYGITMDCSGSQHHLTIIMLGTTMILYMWLKILTVIYNYT